MKNETKFKEMISLVGEKYQKEISQAMASMIWQILKPYPDSVCEKAFIQVIRNKGFFQNLIPDIESEITGTKEDQTQIAWMKVDKAVKKIGPYGSVKFDDPAIHSVIKSMGGWVQFQNCDMAEWKWKKKEFENLYVTLSKQSFHAEYLPGIHETQNLGRGFDKFIPAPILIAGNISEPVTMIAGPKEALKLEDGNQNELNDLVDKAFD